MCFQVFVVSASAQRLPLQIDDASRPETGGDVSMDCAERVLKMFLIQPLPNVRSVLIITHKHASLMR